MINFRNCLLLILIACIFSATPLAAKTKNKAYRDFWRPQYLGQRLDYCSFDGKACGREVANQYCHMLGYDYAQKYVIAHNVGLTNYMGTRQRCVGWRCNGFMLISCAMGLSHYPPKPYHYREKRFEHPRFNNYRIDWCYERNKGCGKRAANAFCSHMGYLQAKRIVKETGIGATRTIGSQELCFGQQCNSFARIICYR